MIALGLLILRVVVGLTIADPGDHRHHRAHRRGDRDAGDAQPSAGTDREQAPDDLTAQAGDGLAAGGLNREPSADRTQTPALERGGMWTRTIAIRTSGSVDALGTAR